MCKDNFAGNGRKIMPEREAKNRPARTVDTSYYQCSSVHSQQNLLTP